MHLKTQILSIISNIVYDDFKSHAGLGTQFTSLFLLLAADEVS